MDRVVVGDHDDVAPDQAVNMAESVRVAASGARDVEVILWEWLRTVPELRGNLQRRTLPLQPSEMGAASELVVALASTGAATVLATSIQTWLTNRHSDVTVTVTTADGRQASVNATRAHDMSQVQDLLRSALASDAPGRSSKDEQQLRTSR